MPEDPDVYAGEAEDTPYRIGDPELETGGLLKDPERKAAETVARMWDAQNDFMSRREAQWEVNVKRRAGIKNVQLRVETDDRSWYCWTPPNAEETPDVVSAINKAATLCRKFAALMFADPPAPDPSPASGEDEDTDAAEFTGRMLVDLQSAQKLRDPTMARTAFDLANSYGSGFVYYRVDPRGGGRMKVEVSAGFDPGTQEQAAHVKEAARRPDDSAWPEYTEKYVTGDGTLTEDARDAAERDVPGMVSELLTGRNLRFIPHNCIDIWDADGVMIASFQTYGRLRKQFPDLEDLEDDDKEHLFSYKPKRSKYVMTPEERREFKKHSENEDERLICTFTVYYKNCPDYPRGAYILTAADRVVLKRDEWAVEDDDGQLITLPIPVSQYAQWREGDLDPYFHGLMEMVGPGNEIRTNMISNLLDHVDRLINRKIFLPTTSTLQPRDFRQAGHTPIPINPGGEPKYEEIPSYPKDGMDLFKITSDEMENDVGLGQVAQGLESPQVQSGKHAQAIISQVHSGLSDIRENIINGYLRGCHIQVMLVRAFYDTPTRIGWVGEDGAYKEKRWTGADLRRTADVNLKEGTLSMLSPIAKSQLAYQFAEFGFLRPDELRDIVSTNLGGMLGVQDDPFLNRVRRQIAAWLEGPPEDWQPALENVPMTDPMTGQPLPDPEVPGKLLTQEQQIMDERLLGIFRPYLADDEPHVALIRLRELSKLMSRTEFSLQMPEWQFGVTEEFNRAKMAATPDGQQPGQEPGMPSPAQRTDGPLALPETPLPEEGQMEPPM